MNTQRVLLFASNPEDTQRLRLDREVREIDAKIAASEHRDAIQLIVRWAVRPDDILHALLQYLPTIVHFSGHTAGEQGLVFEDNEGAAVPVSTSALASLFSVLNEHGIRLVVLNGCFTETQADTIGRHVDYVIGLSHEIVDTDATMFVSEFYRSVASGSTILRAFELAKAALEIAGSDAKPVLRTREGADPSKESLVPAKSSSRKTRRNDTGRSLSSALRNHQLMVLVTTFLISIFGLLYLFTEPAIDVAKAETGIAVPVLLGALLAAASLWVVRYLNLKPEGEVRTAIIKRLEEVEAKVKRHREVPRLGFEEREAMLHDLVAEAKKELAETMLSAEVAQVRKELEELATNVTKQDRAFTEQLAVEVRSRAAGDLLETLEKRVEEKLGHRQNLQLFDQCFSNTRGRLTDMVDALNKKANVNLGLGMFTAILGLGVLAYFVLPDVNNDANDNFLSANLPRFALVVVVELLAYFFLRLYRASLADIKYFQNELTNVEARFAALRLGASFDSSEDLGPLLTAFVATERNFVLEKGQSTVDLEMAKLDTQSRDALVATLTKLVDTQLSKGGPKDKSTEP